MLVLLDQLVVFNLLGMLVYMYCIPIYPQKPTWPGWYVVLVLPNSLAVCQDTG